MFVTWHGASKADGRVGILKISIFIDIEFLRKNGAIYLAYVKS